MSGRTLPRRAIARPLKPSIVCNLRFLCDKNVGRYPVRTDGALFLSIGGGQ